MSTHTHTGTHTELTFEAYKSMTYFLKSVTNKNKAGVMGRGSEKACDHGPEYIHLRACGIMSNTPTGLWIPEGRPKPALAANQGPAMQLVTETCLECV